MSQPEINLGRFVANSAFTDTPFRFVKLSSGKLVKCGAGEAGLGVIQDEPAANEAGNVMVVGVTKVMCGGSISQSNTVKSDANGKAVAASATDDYVFGTALEGGSDGEYIDVLLFGANGARTADSIVQMQVSVPAYATNADGSTVAFKAPFDCTVTAAAGIPADNITGAASNHRKWEIVNKGADGNGTTVVADLAFDNGVNATDFNETALTLSATPANLDVDEGDVLAWVSTSPGTGIADPGGLAVITIQRR